MFEVISVDQLANGNMQADLRMGAIPEDNLIVLLNVSVPLRTTSVPVSDRDCRRHSGFVPGNEVLGDVSPSGMHKTIDICMRLRGHLDIGIDVSNIVGLSVVIPGN